MAHQVLAFTHIDISILILLGIGVLGGAIGAWFFQKIKIPQVIGYITFGIIAGKSGLNLINTENIEQLKSFTWFALGIIGFLVGSELKISTFKKYGSQFVQILLWEGLSAFFLVALAVFGIVYVMSSNISAALAAGIVFGAIASATDPASTVNVLWEYRAKGILTTTITAIVALDDALAMTLYGIGTSFAAMLLGQGSSISEQVMHLVIDLFGSIAFGVAAALIMTSLLSFIHQTKERTLAISIGLLLCVIGLASALDLDVILVTMAMGMVLVNIMPNRSEALFKITKNFSIPIYVMFFVLVGARLGLKNMPGWLWAIVAAYVFLRSAGKMFGCFMGAKLSHADKAVQKYSGLGIFAQGGVAIGLSIMASNHLGNIFIADNTALGDVIITGVTATTFIVQIIGPPLTKLSIKLAKENDKNITEEDIINKMTVGQAIIRDVTPLKLSDNISHILERFSTEDNLAYPVVDENNQFTGLVTLGYLKDVLSNTDCWDWIVADDVMVSDIETIDQSAPLKKGIRILTEKNYDQIPVISGTDNYPVGILDLHYANRTIKQELIKAQAPHLSE